METSKDSQYIVIMPAALYLDEYGELGLSMQIKSYSRNCKKNFKGFCEEAAKAVI